MHRSRRWRWLRAGAWAAVGAASVVATGWMFARYTGGLGPAAALAGQVSPARWAAVIALTLVFYGLDWLRYFALFRLLGRPYPLGLGLELVAISYFVSSLTPSAELHLPAMVIVLVSRGYSAAEATAATVTKSVYMVLWVIGFGLLGLGVADGARVPAVVRDHLALWLVTPLAIGAMLAVVVIAPGPIERWSVRRQRRPGLPAWRRRGLELVARLPHTLATIGRARRPMHLLAHGACVAFIATYALIGRVLADGVGVDVDGRGAYAASAVGLMVSYLSPVPGSIGVTEAATAHLLDPAMGAPAMTAAILARICTWYAAAMIGAVLSVRALRRIGRARFARAWRGEPDDGA